jgi:hypothetical protein
MATTSNYALPYPEPSDPVNVAEDIELLAKKIDTSLGELVQDTVGGMVSSNTENGISVTYNDELGKLNFNVTVIPNQTDNEGKYLTTDGTDVSWESVDALPDQTGNTGKFLTTDGTDATWETVDALPDQTDNEGKFLTTDGTDASWTELNLDEYGVTVSDTAPSSPSAGNVWFNSSEGTSYIYYDGFWVPLSPAIIGPEGPAGADGADGATGPQGDPGNDGALSPNFIINGAFEINQRAATGINPGAGTPGYLFDRWFGLSSEGAGTYSVETFTPGNAIAGHEPRNFMRASCPLTTKSTMSESIGQRIEDVRTFAGQTVTISFWAKAGSGTPSISIELNQNFGSGGSPSSEVNTYVDKIALSTSWTRYTETITIPSISGKTIGTTINTSYLELRIWCSAGSDFNARTNTLGLQQNTFDFWGVQLEAGTAVTPFRRNAPSIQAELAACQRYYFRGGNAATGIFNAATTARFSLPYPVEMRSQPTISAIAAPIIINPQVAETQTGSQTTGFVVDANGGTRTTRAASKIQLGGFASGADGRVCAILNDCLEFSAEL